MSVDIFSFDKYISFMKISSNIVNKVDLEKYIGSHFIYTWQDYKSSFEHIRQSDYLAVSNKLTNLR